MRCNVNQRRFARLVPFAILLDSSLHDAFRRDRPCFARSTRRRGRLCQTIVESDYFIKGVSSVRASHAVNKLAMGMSNYLVLSSYGFSPASVLDCTPILIADSRSFSS